VPALTRGAAVERLTPDARPAVARRPASAGLPQEHHPHHLINKSDTEKPLLGERSQVRVDPPLVYGAVGYLLFCSAVLIGLLVVIA